MIGARQKHFEWIDPPLERFDIVSRDTPEGRIYTGPNGKEYWSMTTMLGKTSEDDGWLEEWRARLGAEAAEIESQRCRDRGEGIHLGAELYLSNEPLSKCLEAAGQYRRLFNQIKMALDSNVTKVYAIELPVFSERMKVGGRLDLLAEWRGELALIDHKGSNSFKTVSQTEEYRHQLCGYSLSVEEMYGLRPKKLINIIANEKSLTPSIMMTDRKDVIGDFAARINKFHRILRA